MQTISKDVIEHCRSVPLHLPLGLTNPKRKVKIRCPFHAERTPSCVLFPTGGYKCFGCGKGSRSTIDFVMALGYTFTEAVEEIRKYL